jgi:methyltransferase of ATP-grasp peptide maturase system
MTVLTEEWADRVHQLAEQLVAAGKLWSPPWREAVCAVPRHELVPDVLRREPDGSWHRLDTTTAQGRREWLDQVYSNNALLTAVADPAGPRSLRSSSSMPGLMTRMLEALDVRDGHRVLEIGTGTGYNVALLAHRLGDANVFSVDIESDLVELARQRLAGIDCHPTLVAADGAAGLAEHAPFDRIIATCAVPALPWAGVEQTRPGGVILTDIKTAPGAGSLVRLSRYPDRAEGHFDPTYAAFMDLRHHPADQAPKRSRPRRQSDARPEQHTTTLDPRTPWNCLVAWFLASFDLGADTAIGYGRPDHNYNPTVTSITTGDGSWAEVSLTGDHGAHQVREGGPRRVWQIIENAHALWTTLGQPSGDRLGLTVTKGHQRVWLDAPTGSHIWSLVSEPNPLLTVDIPGYCPTFRRRCRIRRAGHPLQTKVSSSAWLCAGPHAGPRSGWIDEFDAEGDDAEGFAFGGIDLADVGQLFLAGGQRVYRGDKLVVEHLVEGGVARDAGDAGEDFVALAAEPDQRPFLDLAAAGVVDPNLGGFPAGGDEVEVALVDAHLVGADSWLGRAGGHQAS